MSPSLCGADSAATVASYRCRVVEHYWVNRRYKYIRLEADAPIARITRPGQFYQLKCPVSDEAQPFLLRPMSVYGAGPEDGRIEFLYNVTGLGTRAMASLPADGHMDIVGPLGNTFAFEPAYRRILVVARGVGLATMAPLVRQAAEAGVAITAVMSARTRDDLMDSEFLRGADAQVHGVFDEDGSSAVEAVEGLLRRLIDEQRPDALYTCGSHRLLMLLQRVLADYPQVRGEVAMEQRMACGMGVCLSCVRMFDCDGDKQFLRVCREGPVFSIREVVGEVEFG
ncbi:dihydroorotate dehydrogenase electron transfer subunit [Cupriavidus sp. 2TAF22]|uniref:dihydroorotate dehydrogenase electron transfer subunit n=1 Tax=unclassified Cupriavidus TaxID=2640874 RepID=UPI003F9124F6